MTHVCKRTLALILAIILVLGTVPATAFTAGARYSDTSGHWASAAIERWSDRGVLSGHAGRFRPDDPITRAEMAAVLQRVVGYAEAAGNPFSDVSAGKWYYGDVLGLAAAGVMEGYGGKARPEDKVTREEAAALLSRAFDMREGVADPKPFNDAATISAWAADFVGGLHAAGYITGKPGNVFGSKSNITRAELVTILDNMVKGFYSAPGEYGGTVTGNAVIRAGGVTLKDVQISRDFYLMEGIGGDSATLDHVTVAQTTHIRGGGPSSIHVTGGDLGAVEMNSLTNTHLVLSADTKVTRITMLNSGTVTRGGITVALNAAAGSLTLGGTIDKAVLNADGSMTVTAGGIIYEIIPPEGGVKTLTLSAGSVVRELNLNAPLHIAGAGQFDQINIHASGSVIDGGVKIKLENIIVDQGITVTLDGKTYTGTGGALATGGAGGSDSGNTAKVYYETFGEPQIAPSTVLKGSTLSAVPQPARPDSVFTGWYTDAAFTEPFDAARPVTGSMTLYAAWSARDNNGQEHAESNKFIDNCSPRHAIAILSPEAPLTGENLADYVLIEGTEQIPGFSVTDRGDGRFELSPQADYEAGCLYTFSMKDAALTFDGEDAAVRSLTIRPTKEETKVIDFNDGILDVDWDDVSDYTVDDETGVGSMKLPALQYSAVKDAFRLNSANPEARTTIRIQDFTYGAQDEGYRETEYRNITDLTEADGVLTLETENSQLVDVFDDLEVYLPNVEIDLDDYIAGLDLQALEAQAAQSAGARKMGELLNAALAESPTIQGLLAEPMGEGLPPSADYGFKVPSQENLKPLLPDILDMVLELADVEVTTGETDNANFYNKPGYFVTVKFNYKGTIKEKVEVEASFVVTEYMSLFAGLDAKYQGVWYDPGTWDNLELTFLTNIYSQTDITVDVFAKSVSKDPAYAYEIDVTEEFTKLMNGDEEPGEGASALLKKVLADQGDYVDLIALPIVETSIKIIPEAPVVEVEIKLDFVVKASFAAGIHADMTFLGARALGFYYNLDNGEKKNYNLPFTGYDNQYYIDLWAAGYFGLKAGLRGEVSVGVVGLKSVFDAGMSMELGVYADMYGLVHLRHYKNTDFGKGSEVQGGLYFEVGIYLEMEIFVRSEVFGAKAGWKFLDKKWPVYTFGDRYLLTKFVNGDSHILTRGDLPLTGGAGLFDAQFIDLKTGEIVRGGEYANPKNFNIVILSPYFEVDRTSGNIKIRTDKFGNPAFKPYVAPGTKTLSAAANIYYNGSALAFGTHTVVPYGFEDLMYSQKGVTLVWADPSLDISDMSDMKSYTATYTLELDGKKTLLDQREVLVGQVPGAPVLPQSDKFLYFSWKDLLEYDRNCVVKGVSEDFGSAITEDTEYVITAEKLQCLEALVTHYGDRWHFDVYAVNSGETPVPPAGYDAPFGGWAAPVDWYVETGYPAISVTALDKLQPAGKKYTIGQTADGRGMVSYRPDLAWVSGYPTGTPIYSFEYDIPEDYSGSRLYSNHSAGAYVHKWTKPPKDLAVGPLVYGSLWNQHYDGLSTDWTRFYEYLYVAEYSQKKYKVTFNAGAGRFAPYMEECLDGFGMYSGEELMGTSMGVLAASAVIAPDDDPASTYALTGWKDQDGNTYGLDGRFTVEEEMSFTAVYTAVPDVYTITVYPVGATFPGGAEKRAFSGGLGAAANIDLDFNLFDDWKLSAGVGYEYVFDGWYATTGEDKLTAWPSTFGASGKDARNIVIVAKIRRVTAQHTVTFNANGGVFPGGENRYTKDCEHGAVIDPAEIPAPTRASDTWYDYTFAGWALYDPLEPVTRDASYFAIWDMELRQDAPLPAGIFISDGVMTEDINSVNIGEGYTPIEGYKYEVVEYSQYDSETGQSTYYYIPTLTVTGNGLTLSGSVLGGVSDIEDMVALVIADSVTDVTFKDLSLTGLFEYTDVIYADGDELLTITVSGDCHLEKYNHGDSGAFSSALRSYRDVRLLGADDDAALEITVEKAYGISAYGDMTFENLKLTVEASGVISVIDYETYIVIEMAMAFGSEGGSVMRFVNSDVTVRSPGSRIGGSIVLAGNGDFEYQSTDDSPSLRIGGSLTFEEFEGTFHASFEAADAGPAVIAKEGISFTFNDLPADPEDYGVIVKQCEIEIEDGDLEDYYTFTDETGSPLSEVTVQRR